MPKKHTIRVLIAVAVSLTACSAAAWALERGGVDSAEQVSAQARQRGIPP